MKTNFFILFLVFFVTSCKKDSYNNALQLQNISERVSFEENEQVLKLKSGKFIYEIPKKSLPYKRVVLLNSSLLGYFNTLGLEGKIVGLSSPEYVYSEKIQNLVKNNLIQNVGDEQKYDVEKIIALKPDVVLTNYIPTFENVYELLEKNGITMIFLDEYLEQKPLEKSAYLKVFGRLFGKEKEAEIVYSEIEKQYTELKNLTKNIENKPKVLVNEMYGNQWFMSGGRTQVAYFLADSGAEYILSDNQESISVPLGFEEVFVRANGADFWVNAGTHQTKKSLLSVNPNYGKMRVFSQGKIFSMTGKIKNKANDFYENGSVRSDSVLMDYVKIFHPELLPKHRLIYMNELK